MDTATAIQTGTKAVGYLSDLADAIAMAKDHGINSLTEYTKRTLISSRVYVEDVISGEPTVMNILKFVNYMYACQILVALNLNTVISEGKSVREMVAPVSTETFHCFVDLIKEQFGDKNVEVAAVEDDSGKEKEKAKSGSNDASNGHDVKIETDASKLFTGRLMAVTLGTGENKATIYLLVQLVPYILPGPVMSEYIGNNSNPSFKLRKLQWKTGEIKFWRDFIFECDRVEKRRKALRLDKDGILREVEDHRSGKLWKSIKNFFVKNGNINRNIANTIIICNRNTIDRCCRDLGLNLKNFNDRQNIMANTFSMMLIVYDPNYDTIDLYMNGVAMRGEYNAQMLASFSKKEESVDMKQLLTLIAAGNAPKF